MVSMDTSLLNLYKSKRITTETAINFASNLEMLKKGCKLKVVVGSIMFAFPGSHFFQNRKY